VGYAVLWAEVADEYGCEDAVRGGMRGVGGWEDERRRRKWEMEMGRGR